jgi:hypothetical protein
MIAAHRTHACTPCTPPSAVFGWTIARPVFGMRGRILTRHWVSHRDDLQLWQRAYAFFDSLAVAGENLQEILLFGLLEPRALIRSSPTEWVHDEESRMRHSPTSLPLRRSGLNICHRHDRTITGSAGGGLLIFFFFTKQGERVKNNGGDPRVLGARGRL